MRYQHLFLSTFQLLFVELRQICTRNLAGVVELENFNRYNQLIFSSRQVTPLEIPAEIFIIFFEKGVSCPKNLSINSFLIF